MRRNKKLRQGHTVYIYRIYWDSDLKFYYSKVHKCKIVSLRRFQIHSLVKYESYEECIPGLPTLAGYIVQESPANDPIFMHNSGIKLSLNRALREAQHKVMLLNYTINGDLNA